MCPQVLENSNFISRIVFTDEAKFHISGRVRRHICVLWGSKPQTEYLEHEWDSAKLNVCCPLTHERVIVLFFFKRNVITSISLPDMLENNAHPQLNKNVMLHLDGVPVHFALIVREYLNVNFLDLQI
jgi:hypothetical protein